MKFQEIKKLNSAQRNIDDIQYDKILPLKSPDNKSVNS